MMGARIKQARIAAGMSLRDLANKTNNYVSAQAIHKYELGTSAPGSDVLIRLSKALGVKVEFFFRPLRDQISLSEPVYRKKSSLPKKKADELQARVKDVLEKYLEVEGYFGENRFPKLDLPADKVRKVRSMNDVEHLSRELRRTWALGIDPIQRLIEVLEDRGVKVVTLDAEKNFDGLSCWANENIPVIVVRNTQESDRLRLSLAHELGHLLMDLSPSLNPEKAAHRFAGAFLVPEEAARAELGNARNRFSSFELLTLREKYGMSVQAWIYRAYDLNIISHSFLVQLVRFLKSRGLYNKELGKPLPPEEPARFKRLVVQAVDEKVISPAKGAEMLDISLNELRRMLEVGTLSEEPHS